MDELDALRHSGVAPADVEPGVLNYGARNPIFLGGMGAAFTRRLGGNAEQEMAFFNANTDGLVVDGMRNPGETVLRREHHGPSHH